jgi:hypothetical protein
MRTKRMIVNDPARGGEPVLVDVQVDDASPSNAPDIAGGASRPRAVNYGTRTTYNPAAFSPSNSLAVQGGGEGQPNAFLITKPIGALQATFDEPTAVTIYVSGVISNNGNGGPTLATNARPVAIITYGVGGGSFTERIDACQPRGKLSIIAEYFDVSVCYESLNGAAISNNTQCTFLTQIASGVDPDFVTNTVFVPPPTPTLGPSLLVQAGAGRIQSIFAYDSKNSAAGGGADTLMFFDAVSVALAGVKAKLAFPLAAFPSFISIEFLRSQATFQNGIVWIMSSTPGDLTTDAGALARVDVEIMR